MLLLFKGLKFTLPYVCGFIRKLCSLRMQYNKECLLLYAFFWVIPRHMNFIFQCFGTICLFYMPTFWNTLSVPDGVFQNVDI
jgi:hypothetical protein